MLAVVLDRAEWMWPGGNHGSFIPMGSGLLIRMTEKDPLISSAVGIHKFVKEAPPSPAPWGHELVPNPRNEEAAIVRHGMITVYFCA
jgi:hypothetical protein